MIIEQRRFENFDEFLQKKDNKVNQKCIWPDDIRPLICSNPLCQKMKGNSKGKTWAHYLVTENMQ